MQDQCLIEFEAKWIGAEPKERAQILSAMIMYVKRRYDVQNFKNNIDAKTKQLEQIVHTLDLKEFLPVSRAISYARKQIKELGNTYGSGLKRRPTGADLREARSFAPTRVDFCADIEPDEVEDEEN
jgi:hypothetical protein